MDNGVRCRPRRSRAATCGSSGPAAMTGSGTRSRGTASRPSICSRSSPRIRARPIATASIAIATRAGIGSARSMNPASRSPPRPIRNALASGSTCARKDCPPDPFEDETKYPGVKIGARGTTFADGSNLAGRLLFRLSDRASSVCACSPIRTSIRRRRTNGIRSDITPTRTTTKIPNSCGPIGSAWPAASAMSAQVRFTRRPIPPIRQWADLNSTVGSQYLWMDRVFVYSADAKNFLYQLVHSYPPGTMDTSLVSTDYINNPRTMNAVYLLGRAARRSASSGARRRSQGGELNNKQLAGFLRPARHVLVAARAEGRLGFGRRPRRAQPRLSQHRSLQRRMDDALQSVLRRQEDHRRSRSRPPRRIRPIGARPRPARRNMAKFLLKAGQPDRLADAPGGKKYLTADAATLDARQEGLRRDLRALPFEQAARRGARQARSRAAVPDPTI